jgi:hypothetical protein
MFLELAMAYDIVTAANCLTKRNQILCNLEIRLNSGSFDSKGRESHKFTFPIK